MNTYGDIGNEIAGWYSKRLLRHAQPQIVLENFGLTKTLPKNNTDTIQFRRPRPFSAATIPLTEGVTPGGSKFSYDSVTVIIQQYGDYSEITEKVDLTSKNRVFYDMGVQHGENAGRTREALTWDIVRAGTNVTYGSNFTTRTAVTKLAAVTHTKHRSIISMLHAQKAMKFTKALKGSENYESYTVAASYVAVTHTDVIPQLRDLKGTNVNSHFTPIEQYGQSMRSVSMYEVGTFEEARFVCTADLMPFRGAGATAPDADALLYHYTTVNSVKKYDVYPILYLGKEAFGCIVLRGRNAVQPIAMRPGVPRSSDKLGMTGWIGWKMWFACSMLNEAWANRFEVAVAS